ncbi:uncharacterized protein LOC132697105 [Cylas formicarius]|uniref:uncharacterized protein LOC132697105 n=1 Tax=Cylas formicarius TaxID=197179 RepID=UPI0029584C8C|nr:uncharacterized protein LOC132697105 [Cylas formicarius]
MADVNKNKRKAIKSSLTRFVNHFDSIKGAETNLDELQTRLNRAEKLLDDFNDVQLQIESADENCDTNYDNLHAPERESFENTYFKIISEVRNFISINNESVMFQSQSPNSQNSPQIANNDLMSTRLPTLDLPTFDGAAENWLFFRDTFLSVIHKSSALADVQKFNYLLLSLKGTAADTIKSLQVSDANYSVAWKMLEERFENIHLLVTNYIKAIFNLPTITKESHQGLRQLLDGMQKNLRSLNVLNCPTDQWDDLLIYLISSKFDNSTRRAWEFQNSTNKLPTLDCLTSFLKERCRILESIESNDLKQQQFYKQSFIKSSKSLVAVSTRKCALCEKDHTIYYCSEFTKLSPNERLNAAKHLRLCINCLNTTHSTKDCKSTGCRKCGKIHHTLLHFPNKDSTQNTVTTTTANDSDSATSTNSSTSVTLTVNTSINTQILLSTAVVTIFDRSGTPHDCRVLLDNGSQSNFISQRCCNILNLPKTKVEISIFGINQLDYPVNYMVSVEVNSKTNNFRRTLSCLVLPSITGDIPAFPINRETLTIPNNLTLADPDFHQPAPVDILIGADTFWDLLCIGQIKLGTNAPILQKTKLGWIISGPIVTAKMFNTSQTHFCHLSTDQTLQTELTKFWELEEYPKTTFLSNEEIYCENHFKQNTTRNDDGRFVVTLPLKDSISKLGDSRAIATNRFLNLERKLNKNLILKTQYHEFINEYLKLNHMSLDENQQDSSGFFLPHHGVFKESSTTTKLRVVFDGSAKSSSGISLNDLMLVGPTIQDNLFNILLRFRRHNIVLSADIAKMYRQVLIAPNQRKLQRIIWRFNPDDECLVYNLNTATYGTTSAPFLAIRSLHEVAHRHKNDLPKICSIILHDFYVDDLLTGGDTKEEVQEIKDKLSKLLNDYGFPLRKWSSNDTSIQSKFESNILHIGEEQNKTLGLLWDSKHDNLQYVINSRHHVKVTKRQILSIISQIFDPLGLLSPVTISAKIILQQLWKLKISWDESVPTDLYYTWSKYHSQLIHLNKVKIPRHVLCINPISIQLHGFSDSSEKAYGACIYLRCTDTFGNVTSKLYTAKTRVAPLKQTTIPRLELCGALLLAELASRVILSTNITFQRVTYWCDSTIVISWISTSPSLLKTFVANRISQIQALTVPDSWKYVNTFDNPADLCSRGIEPTKLSESEIWFHGPKWLIQSENHWPTQIPCKKATILPELRQKTLISTTYEKIIPISRFSSLLKLKRVFAYVHRFINNTRKEKNTRTFGSLTPSELCNSLNHLIRLLQIESFPDDYQRLFSNSKLDNKSKLLSLNPFFDSITQTI